jgi:SNF2 family DNA or RNA helicase
MAKRDSPSPQGAPGSKGERALYEALREQARERLDRASEVGMGQRRMQFPAQITRPRRACCHPRLVLPDSDLPGAKLETFATKTHQARPAPLIHPPTHPRPPT